LDISEKEFHLDSLHVGNRIDFASDVCYVGVVEATDDLENRIDFANVTEEFIPESFTFASAFDNPSNIDEFEHRWDDLLGLDEMLNSIETRIWDTDNPFVWFDGAERIVRSLGSLSSSQSIEEGAFANIR
jgi:hypothetical protein